MSEIFEYGELSPANQAAWNLYNNNASLQIVEWNMDMLATCGDWNDIQWSNFTFTYLACGDLQPNDDIAGIGIMISFVTTAIITVLAAIFKGICMAALVKHGNPFRAFLMPNNNPRWKWFSEHRAEFWNEIWGKLVLGLADQQMVTGFAIIVSGLRQYKYISAYHYYIVCHVAAFSIVTQSMAILVIFDIIHKSLVLYSIRVLVYSATIILYYYTAYSTVSLTGPEGYRAACPATCNFDNSQTLWVITIIAGSPVFGFIVIDFIRKLWERCHIIKHHSATPKLTGRLKGIRMWLSWLRRYWFETVRFIAWLWTIGDLCIGLWSVATSWWIYNYKGLLLAPNFNQLSWGFGQLVACILIALPFLTLFEQYKDLLYEMGLKRLGRDTGGRIILPRFDTGGEITQPQVNAQGRIVELNHVQCSTCAKAFEKNLPIGPELTHEEVYKMSKMGQDNTRQQYHAVDLEVADLPYIPTVFGQNQTSQNQRGYNQKNQDRKRHDQISINQTSQGQASHNQMSHDQTGPDQTSPDLTSHNETRHDQTTCTQTSNSYTTDDLSRNTQTGHSQNTDPNFPHTLLLDNIEHD